MNTIEKIRDAVSSIVDEKKFEIVDITYKRQGKTNVLRMLLDKPGGITMEECSKINNAVSEKLDQQNIIEDNYTLEVSSPGLDRSLQQRRDFERVLGKGLRVSTYAPIDGKNVFIGKLVGLSDLNIVLEDKDGISAEIGLDKIAKARLDIVF